MICPGCGKIGVSKVLESRFRDGSVYRRRECTICGRRFSTTETITNPELKPLRKPRRRKLNNGRQDKD